MKEPAECTILVVDDVDANVHLLETILRHVGYRVEAPGNGREALVRIALVHPDLVLTDILMPEMDGYELVRRLRQDPSTRLLPVVMVTGSGEQEKVKAFEAGADDFVPKPFNRLELLARVKSLLRVKAYQDQIQAQATELGELNRTLEARVDQQVAEMERLSELRRFLSPQLAELVLSTGGEALLQSHRREIAVVFTDLRGFTSFAESAEPEEMMRVLRQYHELLGAEVTRSGATVGFFAGDGLMVFFNDPIPCDDPAVRAVRMTAAMRDAMTSLTEAWDLRESSLGFGAGIALGYATLGTVGFEGRHDYTAIGAVVNQAARLCAEAGDGQVLISQRVLTELGDLAETEPVGELQLKGFRRPVAAFNVLAVR